ncbi:hypothetical protein CMI47_02595 [Candidatus Pacearchaeota archaeon]|jgi:hypothetical protein|nr:hypothetical protein [Candidatus Pacearchaeota archaeon]|tara:strand:+ start:27370 stop:28350 length:981 start_codon:yes stop_codon:yes gene_type:complete
MQRQKKNLLNSASSFCDFYPLINVNPVAIEKYLASFSNFSESVAIPLFLSEFILMLETGVHSSSSKIVGVSLDLHRKSLPSYPISVIIDKSSLSEFALEENGPFLVLSESISIEDVLIKNIVVFDHKILSCVNRKIESCGYNFDIGVDNFDKFIKSSSIKTEYLVNIPSLNIKETIMSSSREKALRTALTTSWKNNENRKFYKRRPSEYSPFTYMQNGDVFLDVVTENSVEKTADASAGAGPDTSWTEGEPLSIKRDDYGRGFRDLPTTSWLGRRVRFRSINESAVDNDGVIIYDKNNIIKVKKSNGAIVNLKKNDPHLFFTIDLI